MERRKINKWNAIIHFNKSDKLHTIAFDGKGGVIISDVNLMVAERKFMEGMNLAESIVKLIKFKKEGTLMIQS